MAKYEQLFEDTQELFSEVINKLELSKNLNIIILADNKAKDLFKVVKANPLLKYRTGDDVIIILNEHIFDQLPMDMKMIAIEESLAYIHYNLDKERLEILKPDITTFSGLLSKHGFENYQRLHESVKSLFNADKENDTE